MQVCYVLILACLIFRVKWKYIKSMDLDPCRIEFIYKNMYFKWMTKNNKIIKLVFSWLPPLLTSFPHPFFREKEKKKKRNEKENGGKGMGVNTETGNYAESLVFWEHGGHSVSVVVGEKDSWETPRAWKLGFCFESLQASSLLKQQKRLLSQAEGSLCKHLLSYIYFH